MVGGAPSTVNIGSCSMWFSWLGISNGHTCGATIISASKLLCAAHCITELPASGVYDARAGLTHLGQTANMQMVRVSRSVTHELYAGGKFRVTDWLTHS